MTHNATRFDDKIALITGGSSGMGLATAQRLIDEGAQVIVTGRDKQRLDAAVAQLGQRATGIAGDATDTADLAALTRVIGERFGRLDVVFVNAGIGAFQSIPDVTPDEFDRVVAINFKAAFFTVQHSLPLLVDGGAIVINASFALYRGTPGTALYSATKAAVHNLTRTMAAELAPKGIRVNSVSPGYTDTPAFRAEVSADAQRAAASLVAAGRIGTSEDVAAAVAFLASTDASYITGQDLLVDGGLTTLVPTTMV
ncbi:glucose 1-dehydrogenase [Nocardia sp. CDC153]|uniref:SDR family NAD(P)-dependent oxidoreductase n=1 Tax=Nocardia sp. CDC153 TaxID=3112167 RepID=UPI002DBB0081|nr:glucose 1-dehydrogenase [Nocardia sp. CDC153]MEC3956618.1 glucose 1-dehydrogenase [Nocardia sp. CDC153]